MEYYSAIKKENSAICSNTNGPRDYHKWSKSERQISHAIMNLKYDTRRQTHRYRERICGCQGGRKDWEFGISRFKLYSTQNCYLIPWE